MSRPILRCGGATLALGERTFVMGVVNATPDSFSDGGRLPTVDAAVAHALALLEAGADLVDIGGESTRPGAEPVAPDVEQERVLPVVEALVARGERRLSVDTRHPETAARALERGASWVNDVSGLSDPAMVEVAKGAEAVVLMHWRKAGFDQREDHVAYDDVVEVVGAALARRVADAGRAGVAAHKILVDPGIGFGKRVEDNLALTRRLEALRGRAAGVLYGPSRKRFLGVISGDDEPAARDPATVGACCYAATRGADVVRVHDAGSVSRALRVVDAMHRISIGD